MGTTPWASPILLCPGGAACGTSTGDIVPWSLPCLWVLDSQPDTLASFCASSHQAQTTCWDHPKMTELYQTLGEEPVPKTPCLCMWNNVRCPQP